MANSGDVGFEFGSSATNGRPITVAATSSPGTTIHTCNCGSNQTEDVEVWLSNTSTTTTLTFYLQLGGTSPSDLAAVQVRPASTVQALRIRLNSTVTVNVYEAGGADGRAWCFVERWTN